MANIVLCRHATTAANAEGRFLSRTDLPLDGSGRAQCESLREKLASFAIERCFVSPMKRCIETAGLALPDCAPVVKDELREIDFGDWELLNASEVEVRWPNALDERRKAPVNFRPPGGESFHDVSLRLIPILDELRHGNVLIVSHRGTLGVLERLLRGVPLDYREIAPMEPAGFRTLSESDVPDHTAPSSVSKTSLQ